MKKRNNEKSYPVHIEESYQSDATLLPILGVFLSSFPAGSDEITP